MPKPIYEMPLSLLVADLLKQFNKPSLLAKHGINLTKAEMDRLAQAIENGEDVGDVSKLVDALFSLVQESVQELETQFGMSYQEALQTQDMSAIGGWETTAEFLEIANIKSNAELRISAGASLMAFLGDKRANEHLETLIAVDDGLDDVDAAIAKRALGRA